MSLYTDFVALVCQASEVQRMDERCGECQGDLSALNTLVNRLLAYSRGGGEQRTGDAKSAFDRHEEKVRARLA